MEGMENDDRFGKPVFCIYHGNCIDGLMAAGVVKLRYPDAEFYAGVYGKPPPLDQLHDKAVIIVDFSYPAAELIELSQAAYCTVVLDHHKTAKEALEGLQLINGQIIFDMNRSGAGMAWDYFFTGKERPMMVNLVEDRDLWQFKYASSRNFHLYLATLEATPERFASLLEQYAKEPALLRGLMLEANAMADQFKAQLITLKREAFTGHIAGYDIPMANVPYIFASELAGELAQDAPFAATYFFNGEDYVFSLRSRGEGGMDVSEIAKQFGGGGHRNASGFKIKAPGIKLL